MNVVVQLPTVSRLDTIARRIQAGYDRTIKGGVEWVEGSLEVAAALLEGRESVPANISFSAWLKDKKLDFYNKNERAALIGLSIDLTLARSILTSSKSRSYDLIWRENKNRFPSARKTPSQHMRKKRTTHPGRAMIHRRMKLGDAMIDSLKGTTLDRAEELDELVILNRGASEGEHTEIVKRLVADAIAGKDVSAIAETARISNGNAGRKIEPLIEAWRKRMIFAWDYANRKEQEKLIEYLMNHMKE